MLTVGVMTINAHLPDPFDIATAFGLTEGELNDALETTGQIGQLADFLIGLTEILPELPCARCNGQRGPRLTLDPQQRWELEGAIYTYLAAVHYDAGHLDLTVSELFGDERLAAVDKSLTAENSPWPEAITPVLDSISEVAALGLSEALDEATEGWGVGMLLTDTHYTCACI